MEKQILKQIMSSELIEKYRRDAREKASKKVFKDGYFSDDDDLSEKWPRNM